MPGHLDAVCGCQRLRRLEHPSIDVEPGDDTPACGELPGQRPGPTAQVEEPLSGSAHAVPDQSVDRRCRKVGAVVRVVGRTRAEAVTVHRRHVQTSISSVAGPSFMSSTCMAARKRPVSTTIPWSRSPCTTRSISGSACSGGAAAIQVGRRPLVVSP